MNMNTPAARQATTQGPSSPARWRRWVPLLILVPTIGAILSGLITWLNIGWSEGFAAHWLRAFLSSLPVIPLGMGIMQTLDRLLRPRLAHRHAVVTKLVLGLCTAVVMELLVASVVTLSNSGWGADFPARWVLAFLRSLPVGLLIGLTMAFLIKPRLERWAAAA